MTLDEAITFYVQRKQATGLRFAKGHETYRAFARIAGNLPLSQITVSQVFRFLDSPHSTAASFRRKHGLLRNFFDYWAARGEITRAPMPVNRPAQRSRFLPYIYTKEELRRLLRAAALFKRPGDQIHYRTVQAIVLMLYATGATVSEVTNLVNEDVDLRNHLIRFSGSMIKVVRAVPIGRDLGRLARRYVDWKKRSRVQSEFFFSMVDAKAIKPGTLRKYCERLVQRAGISGYRESSRGPCLLDLRATFAVHHIDSWIRRKEDLNRLLPALGAYMGNVGIEQTERYLQLTPQRFQNALNKLSPQKSGARWRNDPALLKFLANL